MLDLRYSTEDYKCYVYTQKDNRVRCVLYYKDGTKITKSYPKLIMESVLGRKLTKNEQVHHIDGNPLNNDISNLTVMFTLDHQRKHNLGKTFKISEEQRILCSLRVKELWAKGVYANRKVVNKSEEHKRKISEGLKKYYERIKLS